MIAKDETTIGNLRAAGAILGATLRALGAMARPGTSALELNREAERLIREKGAEPLFLNYKPKGAQRPFPSTLCISVNDEVVHGIPKAERLLQEGDVVSLDLGLLYHGCSVDAARTVIVGEGDQDAKRLVAGVEEALSVAIDAAQDGAHVGDIGAAVSAIAEKYQLSVVRDLGGHGTGREQFHEAPFIANFGEAGEGETLKEGMVLALEPIFTLGRGAIVLAEDGWTYRTRDHSRAAHFENTILITAKGAEVLTN